MDPTHSTTNRLKLSLKAPICKQSGGQATCILLALSNYFSRMFPLPDSLHERFGSAALAACGIDTPGLVPVADPQGPWLRSDVLAAFARLGQEATKEGILLRVESGWRPFERQLSIWNRKVLGQLPLLDAHGEPVDRASLDDGACVEMILNWSALPGTSRHHWGTDLDVVDAAAMPPGYEPQLTPAESAGIFAPLHAWLDERIARGESYGFRRVFEPGRGRVRPERWHLTYAPAARECEQAFRSDLLPELYAACGLELASAVRDRLPAILQDYVTCYFGKEIA